jgi:hypothetical protein
LETIAVVAGQQITRLDRVTELRAVIARAKDPDAELDELSREIVAIAKSPPL